MIFIRLSNIRFLLLNLQSNSFLQHDRKINSIFLIFVAVEKIRMVLVELVWKAQFSGIPRFSFDPSFHCRHLIDVSYSSMTLFIPNFYRLAGMLPMSDRSQRR